MACLEILLLRFDVASWLLHRSKNVWKNFPFDGSSDARNFFQVLQARQTSLASSAPELIVSITPRHNRGKSVSALMTCHNCFPSSNIFQTNYARSKEASVGENPKPKKQNKIVSNSFALAKCDRAENVETITTHRAQQKRKIKLNLNNYF